MKCKLTKPCIECPFRKDSMRGWLGPWSPNDMLEAIGAIEFPCHMTVEPGDVYAQYSLNASFCAGAALHMNAKKQLSRQRWVADFQLTLKGSDQQEHVLQNTSDFLRHHNPSFLDENVVTIGEIIRAQKARAL